jgi:hypothetical protein
VLISSALIPQVCKARCAAIKQDFDATMTNLNAAADAAKQKERDIAAAAIKKIADKAMADREYQYAKFRAIKTFDLVMNSCMARDWEGVLARTRGGLIRLTRTGSSPNAEEQLLHMCTFAMRQWYESSAFNKYQVNYIEMQSRRVDLMGELSQFRDQAALLCMLAQDIIRGPYHEAKFRHASVFEPFSSPLSTPCVHA